MAYYGKDEFLIGQIVNKCIANHTFPVAEGAIHVCITVLAVSWAVNYVEVFYFTFARLRSTLNPYEKRWVDRFQVFETGLTVKKLWNSKAINDNQEICY